MAADPLLTLTRAAVALARPTPSFQLALAAAQPLVAPELVGETWAREMADAARRAGEPMERRAVERALRDVRDELEDIEWDPAAVTPTSQVHRATVDGDAVAVKVVRPGVAESRRSDLRVIDGLAGPLGAAVPGLEVGAVLRELRERLAEELDPEHEGDTARRLARALRGHPTLTVPMPVSRLTTDRVLVSEWMDGRPLAPDGDGGRAAAEAVVRFHVGSARFGLVHADPHPEHVLALGDGRFAFLDAAASRSVDAGRVDLGVAALDALRAGDAAALGEALQALGWLPAAAGPDALALAQELAPELLGGECVLDVALLVRMRDRVLGRLDAIAGLVLQARVAPEDLWPLRMLLGIGLVLAPLGVRADWLALGRAAAAEGF
jgi:predicted unusual protein kinase regulating ubiquinone biosynthesis (AarF/ABC1/UbiB family)